MSSKSSTSISVNNGSAFAGSQNCKVVGKTIQCPAGSSDVYTIFSSEYMDTGKGDIYHIDMSNSSLDVECNGQWNNQGTSYFQCKSSSM